jgi:catechol 2,3-dioxygenase-like lactoylglutathione lyase family enzyme
MVIQLNHTIVPAHDKTAAAQFFARVFGLAVSGEAGPFTPVRLNDELTLDFDTTDQFEPHHYGFLVGDDDFDSILELIKTTTDIPFGAGVESGWNRDINHLNGGRGVYIQDPNGHSYEIFTRAP